MPIASDPRDNGEAATLRIRTSSRLHFGLLIPGSGWRRRYGGLGLALTEPGWVIEAELASDWQITGEATERVRVWLERLRFHAELKAATPLQLHVAQAIPEHVGLGSGTQLALALAWLLARSAGLSPTLQQLLSWTGRGQRSAVGAVAFAGGGFIVDFGRWAEGHPARSFLRLEFPADWRVAVLVPAAHSGLHGEREREVFARFDSQANVYTDRLCRLALLQIVPAVLERRYEDFAEALYEYNCLAGKPFADWQAGPYHCPLVAELIEAFRRLDVPATGQSSWGPSVFAIAPEQRLQPALQTILSRYQPALRVVMITTVASAGAIPELERGTVAGAAGVIRPRARSPATPEWRGDEPTASR